MPNNEYHYTFFPVCASSSLPACVLIQCQLRCRLNLNRRSYSYNGICLADKG